MTISNLVFTTYVIIASACPAPVLEGFSGPLSADDMFAMQTATAHCEAEKECLVRFIRIRELTYHAICGVR